MSKQGTLGWHKTLPLKLNHSRTLLLKSNISVAQEKAALELAEHGFQFLDNHTLVVCLLGLKDTAAKCKDARERELTLEVCGTLYLPVYDDRALWLRRGKEAEALLRAWREELERCDGWLALTRAMHRVQPLAWYLPSIGG